MEDLISTSDCGDSLRVQWGDEENIALVRWVDHGWICQ